MATTTGILGPEFAVELVKWMLKTIDESTKQAYRMIWDAAGQIFLEHWVMILLFLAALLFVSFISALTTRRWAWFGSLLYHYIYLGILWLIGLAFGPEIYANEWFRIVCAIVYIVSFSAVGWVLLRSGLRTGR